MATQSKELSNLVQFARAIIEAEPRLQEVEGLENHIRSLKKQIDEMQGSYRQLQAGIADARDKYATSIQEMEQKQSNIINDAKQQAGIIIANAQGKASSIISSAEAVAQQIEDNLKSKRVELQDLIEKTADAQIKHEQIKNILKDIPGMVYGAVR